MHSAGKSQKICLTFEPSRQRKFARLIGIIFKDIRGTAAASALKFILTSNSPIPKIFTVIWYNYVLSGFMVSLKIAIRLGSEVHNVDGISL